MLPKIAAMITALMLTFAPGNHAILWNGVKIASFNNSVPIMVALHPFVFHGPQVFTVDGKNYTFTLFKAGCARTGINLTCSIASAFPGVEIPYTFSCDGRQQAGRIITTNGTFSISFEIAKCRTVEFVLPGYTFTLGKPLTVVNCAEFPEHTRAYVYHDGKLVLEKEVAGRICFKELPEGFYLLKTSSGEVYELLVDESAGNPLAASVLPVVLFGFLALAAMALRV